MALEEPSDWGDPVVEAGDNAEDLACLEEKIGAILDDPVDPVVDAGDNPYRLAS